MLLREVNEKSQFQSSSKLPLLEPGAGGVGFHAYKASADAVKKTGDVNVRGDPEAEPFSFWVGMARFKPGENGSTHVRDLVIGYLSQGVMDFGVFFRQSPGILHELAPK